MHPEPTRDKKLNGNPDYLFSLSDSLSSYNDQYFQYDIYDNGDEDDNLYEYLSLKGECYSVDIDISSIDVLINLLQKLRDKKIEYLETKKHYRFCYNKQIYLLLKINDKYNIYKNGYLVKELYKDDEQSLEYFKNYILEDLKNKTQRECEILKQSLEDVLKDTV